MITRAMCLLLMVSVVLTCAEHIVPWVHAAVVWAHGATAACVETLQSVHQHAYAVTAQSAVHTASVAGAMLGNWSASAASTYGEVTRVLSDTASTAAIHIPVSFPNVSLPVLASICNEETISVWVNKTIALSNVTLALASTCADALVLSWDQRSLQSLLPSITLPPMAGIYDEVMSVWNQTMSSLANASLALGGPYSGQYRTKWPEARLGAAWLWLAHNCDGTVTAWKEASASMSNASRALVGTYYEGALFVWNETSKSFPNIFHIATYDEVVVETTQEDGAGVMAALYQIYEFCASWWSDMLNSVSGMLNSVLASVQT